MARWTTLETNLGTSSKKSSNPIGSRSRSTKRKIDRLLDKVRRPIESFQLPVSRQDWNDVERPTSRIVIREKRGSGVSERVTNGCAVLLASCKRVCWPWNQWKYSMDEAHGYEARIQARASRLYHEHERSFSLFLFPLLLPPTCSPLHVVKFFRDGHQRRGQIWAFVLFVWNLRPISDPFFHLQRSSTTNPSFFLSLCVLRTLTRQARWYFQIILLPLFVSIRSSLVYTIINLYIRF